MQTIELAARITYFRPSWFSYPGHFNTYLDFTALLIHLIKSLIINNYWMRLSIISWIIKTEVCVICRSRRLRQIIQTRGFDNSWYHAKTEFNNCFIIHFLIKHDNKLIIKPFQNICQRDFIIMMWLVEVLFLQVFIKDFNACLRCSFCVFGIFFLIIHPQKQKRSVQPLCFWGEHSKGLGNQADVEIDMINAISAADVAFMMSSSQAIVNWLNALDQSDFS